MAGPLPKKMTCIECPKGCLLTVETGADGAVVKVAGNKCPKGIGYAIAETVSPVRILTATVPAEGLAVRMVPVRTDKPIPKARLMEAMEMVRMFRVTQPVKAGEAIVRDLLGLEANLIATRDCGRA